MRFSDTREIARTLNSVHLLVPVVRPVDNAKPGPGRIAISPGDPTLVIGYGTNFTKLAPKMQLMFPKATGFALAEVMEIISDTELWVRDEFSVDGTKKTLVIIETLLEAKTTNDADGLDYKILPHLDQGVMYEDVYRRLSEGGSIAIFPEGTSTSRGRSIGCSLTCN